MLDVDLCQMLMYGCYRSGRSSLQEPWATRVTWHQGNLLDPNLNMIFNFMFIFLLYFYPFFPLGNLLSSDLLKDALDGVTSVVCFFLLHQCRKFDDFFFWAYSAMLLNHCRSLVLVVLVQTRICIRLMGLQTSTLLELLQRKV